MVTWSQLRQRLAAGSDTGLTGQYSVLRPRRNSGQGWPPASLARSAVRFAYRPPGRWRLEVDGITSFTDESISTLPPDEPPGLWFDVGEYPWRFSGSPLRLVHANRSMLLTSAIPLTDCIATEQDGRPGWSVSLEAALPAPLRLVVDHDVNVVTLAECSQAGYREQLTELQRRDDLPDSTFTWSQDLAAVEQRTRERLDQLHGYYRHRQLPAPGYWPEPRGEPSIVDGDLTTGFLVIDLGARGSWLIRQSLSDPPYEGGPLRDPEVQVHRWRTERWHWTLAMNGRFLSPDDFERVAASIDAS